MLKISNLIQAVKTECETVNLTKLEVLCDQVIDSAIVGGITWLGQVASTATIGTPLFTPEGFAIGFGLTFLIKLKEYRKVA